MTARDVLQGVTRLGLDAAPVIYFVEGNPQFYSRCVPFFRAVDAGIVAGFTSTLILPETLVHPLKMNIVVGTTAFRGLLLALPHITLVPVTAEIAEQAAQLRVDFNLRTPDAVQIATAVVFGCEVFLTNDVRLKLVTAIRVVTVQELDL